jgi:hypothetical protein
MLSRLNASDPRVVMGKGGRLPNGDRRIHVRDLQPGDILVGGGRRRVKSVDGSHSPEGRVTVKTEALDLTAQERDTGRPFEPKGEFDWKLDSMITREARDGEE